MAKAGAASVSMTGSVTHQLNAARVTRRISFRINRVVLCIKTPTVGKGLLIHPKEAAARPDRKVETLAIFLSHDFKGDFIFFTEALVNTMDLAFANAVIDGLSGGLRDFGERDLLA